MLMHTWYVLLDKYVPRRIAEKQLLVHIIRVIDERFLYLLSVYMLASHKLYSCVILPPWLGPQHNNEFHAEGFRKF